MLNASTERLPTRSLLVITVTQRSIGDIITEQACNNTNIGYNQNNRLEIIMHGISTTTKTE